MKFHNTLSAFAIVLLGNAAALELPTLETRFVGGDQVEVSWDAVPLNPASSTELFPGFQLQRSTDLQTWLPLGEKIDTRINGGAQNHTRTASVEGREYFRLHVFLELAGQDLSGSDLSGVDLDGADLEGADLSGADLSGANLSNARFENITITSLGGPGSRPVNESLPQLAYAGGGAEYADDDDPELDGLSVSTNIFFLSFQAETTTAEANAILAQYGASIVGGVASEDEDLPSIFIVELGGGGSFTDLQDVLDDLENEEEVSQTSINARMGTDAIPADVFTVSDWNWEAGSGPALGNWGLRAAKIPQMWNFNRKIIQMRNAGDRPSRVNVGVLDGGFDLNDTDFAGTKEIGSVIKATHGTHVAGIIAAAYSFDTYYPNGGLEGVNPFARLHVASLRGSISNPGLIPSLQDVWEFAGVQVPLHSYSFADVVAALNRMVSTADVGVINLSLGYGWDKLRDDPNTVPIEDYSLNPTSDVRVQELVASEADIRNRFWQIKNALGYGPMIVSSAGNSSNHPNRRVPFGDIPARWNSPWNYSDFVNDDMSIIVVESASNVAGALSKFSCNQGEVRAPGERILSTVWPNVRNGFVAHKRMGGTSMAAPHVTGVVSYMQMIDPSLTHEEIHEIITKHVGAGTATPLLDGFGAVMDIDRVQGNTKVLKMLVDIDDGTVDGNLRVMRAASFIDADPREVWKLEVEMVPGGDTEGDGTVDIKDFRRWRDWLLQYENGTSSNTVKLDGEVNHYKKDLNVNFRVLDMARENVFPRGDFNGDGMIDRTAVERVRGALSSADGLPGNVTDLQVLQKIYTDGRFWRKEDLPNLLDSFDLEISFYEFYKHNWENPDRMFTGVSVEFEDGNPGFKADSYPVSVPLPPLPIGDEAAQLGRLLLTLPTPPNRYRMRICGIVGSGPGAELYLSDDRINAKPGEDVLVIPVPETDLGGEE